MQSVAKSLILTIATVTITLFAAVVVESYYSLGWAETYYLDPTRFYSLLGMYSAALFIVDFSILHLVTRDEA